MTVLLIAATGGHLAQLDELAPRIPGVDEKSVWVTFDTPQSRSLLRNRDHFFVPYTGSRDLLTAMRNARLARDIIRKVRPHFAVSTGSAIAVSFLPAARLAGVPVAYIESAARADGPSLTGRILQRVPGIQLYSQYPEWAAPPWVYAGSVFDAFAATECGPAKPIRRVLVTLGTMTFGFRRLVERVLEVLPDDCEVVWQVGVTDASGLGIEARTDMPTDEFDHEMRRADVVIAHAGVGSALSALNAGKCPVLVPRERSRGEHIDDHQRQVAARLDHLGLAIHRTVDALTREDIVRAARQSVVRRERVPTLEISSRGTDGGATPEPLYVVRP
jgi:UDP-N-acetylglucosamine--N-acetylmuramyl-(pentapeptide) pyrophosphoryl-undecaprenol N-acetylglucosamine transferase